MGNGPSSLHQAALAGELDQVRLAIQSQPDLINATEPTKGWTALHISASKGYEVIVRELLARGGAPNLVDKDGRTALHMAASQGHVGVIRDLLRKNADPLLRDMSGKSPLDLTLQQQQPAAASMLAEALAGRGFSNTPTDSPTKAQGQAAAQFGAPPAAAGAATQQPAWPNLAGLDLRGSSAPPLVDTPPAAAAAGGPAAAGGVGGRGGVAYPSVPAPFPSAAGDTHWLQQLPVPPTAAGVTAGYSGPVSIAAPSAPPVSGEDEDDWGGADSRPPGSSSAAASSRHQGSSRPGSQPGVNLNAAVGAAVSGAGKVAGAVGSIAVAGAKQLLTGILPKPPGKGSGASDSDGPGSPSSAAATWAGTPGRTYSYGELAAATQGFSDANKLGSGGYGPVYRGVLDGLPVAIKVLDAAGPASGGQQGPKEFAAEVALLSRLHHPHILLLIGSCPERCALVYELMDNGSLEQHLFNPGMPELQWQDRVRIACEVASALVFLHSAPEPIIHMDLKPGNLLLNRSLLAKVGDVGLSRLMPGGSRAHAQPGSAAAAAGGCGPVSTVMDSRLVGTPCYMDPEYLRTGRFGPKSDVYSLGIILLQMLTGLQASRVVSVVEAALARSQGDAASFATAIDPRSGPWPITEAASFAHLAMRCVALERSARPDLRGEVLPALLQLAARSKLYERAGAGPGGVRRSQSLSGGSDAAPSMMVCPITQDVMEDPVFAADGFTYERVAIAAWISSHATSPMTNVPLADSRLTPNLALRSAIKEWQERRSGGRR